METIRLEVTIEIPRNRVSGSRRSGMTTLPTSRRHEKKEV